MFRKSNESGSSEIKLINMHVYLAVQVEHNIGIATLCITANKVRPSQHAHGKEARQRRHLSSCLLFFTTTSMQPAEPPLDGRTDHPLMAMILLCAPFNPKSRSDSATTHAWLSGFR